MAINNPNLQQLLAQVSNANPQAPSALQAIQPSTAPTSARLAAEAGAVKDAFPGLSMFKQLNSAGLAEQEAASALAQKQSLIKGMAADLQSKNYQGALSKYAQLDPDGVKSLLPQIAQIDPNMKGLLSFAGEGGGLAAQTEYGSNHRQLKELELSNQRKREEGKLSDKQDSFAQSMFGKVTSSQDFKNYQEIRQRQSAINEFSKNPSAFGDIANIFGFMKSIDPASVVRESEFATAQQAGGLFTRAQNWIKKAEKGERLTEDQRKDLVRISKHMESAFAQNYKNYMKPVYKQAERRGVPVDLIDPFYGEQSQSATPTAKQQLPGLPSKGQVVDGYTFIGGNPADPSSWRKN